MNWHWSTCESSKLPRGRNSADELPLARRLSKNRNLQRFGLATVSSGSHWQRESHRSKMNASA
jgi:hypothetical protein